MNPKKKLPFLLGAQYYRAPTPEPECWAVDLPGMKALGFNSVKYWVQWRWTHCLNDRFVFDDLDRLMDLAAENGLQVTLNVIFDVAPHWLYERYPDARQVLNNGKLIEPFVVGHRQIGGHPGPCYNHPGALAERKNFMAAVVGHFSGHPALAMWDVWNEPEICFPQRAAHIDTLACYCTHCQAAFAAWLHCKYPDLESLNGVWGRCYETWEQVEVPRSGQTFADFIDWREFHIDSLTREAAWRLEVARQLDPRHVRYLHVVPNVLSIWNPVSCATDDFALAEPCDVFAATMNGGPVLAQQVLSAGRGKTCYNVESHLNFGSTAMHQRVLSMDDLLKDWLPQIGLGIRGFLFWQYRPEVLGLESPAWGLVNLDGSDRPITRAFKTFTEKIIPHAQALMDCPPQLAEVGIWKSRKNEIFHFAMHGEFGPLVDSLEGYIQTLYWQNIPYRIISGEMLAGGGLEGVKLLILPSPYCLTEPEARNLAAWIRQGGVVISEAHLGGYNATKGRHSRQLPGCGLAEEWGFQEADSTSSYHLKPGVFTDFYAREQGLVDIQALPADVRKAMADFRSAGSLYYPIRLAAGGLAWGASRYARLEGEDLRALGWFEPDIPCLIAKETGAGAIFYFASHIGQGTKKDPSGLLELVRGALKRAGIRPAAGLGGPGLGEVRVDRIADQAGPRYLVIHNRSEQEQEIQLDCFPDGEGLFTGVKMPLSAGQPMRLPGGFIDLIVLDSSEVK